MRQVFVQDVVEVSGYSAILAGYHHVSGDDKNSDSSAPQTAQLTSGGLALGVKPALQLHFYF